MEGNNLTPPTPPYPPTPQPPLPQPYSPPSPCLLELVQFRVRYYYTVHPNLPLTGLLQNFG